MALLKNCVCFPATGAGSRALSPQPPPTPLQPTPGCSKSQSSHQGWGHLEKYK